MNEAERTWEFSTSKVDASLFPRTYRTYIGNRIFLTLVASANAVGGLLGMVYFSLGHEMKGPGERLFFVFLSFLFVALGSYLVAASRCFVLANLRLIEPGADFGARTGLRHQLKAGSPWILARI